MSSHIRIKSIKRKEIDEDKLALAFLLLAKILYEADAARTDSAGSGGAADSEAA
jgi:hypothetical protein